MMIYRVLCVALMMTSLALPSVGWGSRSVYDLGGGLEYFSGKVEKSLAPETGMIVRLGAQSGDDIFRWTTNLTVARGSGESDFDDQGTARTLNFSLIGGEFNFGFALYPLGGESKLILQPYLMATGSAHLASIGFDKDATVSEEFPKSDAAMMFGYALGVGADFSFDKEWGLKLHIEQSQISGSVAGTSFGLGGQRVLIGFFFR